MSTNTALAKTESAAMTFGRQIGYTPEYIELIKNTYAKDATDNELQMFLEVCHQSKLNPFKKEIYFWKQAGKVIIHTGIDGYRLVADRTGRYAPGKPIKRTYENGVHTASTAYVRKKVGSDWFDIEETAYMSEWVKDSPFWKGDKKSHQLDITAERHALRKAFPASYASLDTSNPDGSPVIDVETTEQIEARKHLSENLLKIGKLFTTNDEQYRTLEATIAVSALPVLEERYTNAIAKLREYTLGKIGEKLQGEAFSAFIVKTFPIGIDAADADEFFAAVEALKDVEPGEVVEAAAEPADADAEAERAAMQNESEGGGEPVSAEEAELVSLREAVINKLMTVAAGDDEKMDRLLDGRSVNHMTKGQLERFLKSLEAIPF